MRPNADVMEKASPTVLAALDMPSLSLGPSALCGLYDVSVILLGYVSAATRA